jgi:hypothetical protein
MVTLMLNRDSIGDRLIAGLYAHPALVPASPWLGKTRPEAPTADLRADSVTGRTLLTIRPAGPESVWLWVVQALYGAEWTTRIIPGTAREYVLAESDASAVPQRVVVRAVDRIGVESDPVDATDWAGQKPR